MTPLQDRTPTPDWRAYGAEFAGTLLFVFAAAASVVMTHFMGPGGGGLLAMALTQGLALMALSLATAPHSGGHLNPAITLGALTMGRIAPHDALGYVAAQCLGAVVGALFVGALLPIESVAATFSGTPVLGTGTTPGRAFALELLLGTLVAAAAFGTLGARAREASRATGTALGAAYFVGVMLAAPLTGAALNPARALGPALTSGRTEGLWLYVLAPLLGGLLAATAWRLLGTTAAPERRG